MIEGLIAALAVLLAGAFALPLAKLIVRGWVRIYTAPVHPELRARRREEIESDLWEQQAAEREAGYRPVEIGLRLVARWILGVPADLLWSIPRALPLEDYTSVSVLLLTIAMALGYQDLYGPLPAVGPLSAELADGLLRAILASSALIQTFRLRYYQRLRFARPPIIGNSPEAIVARIVQLDDQVRAERAERVRRRKARATKAWWRRIRD
jgi:hypothetical protein